jgi:hypothetical protein
MVASEDSATFRHRPAIGALMILAVVMVAVLLLSGIAFFKRTERTFVDLI